MIMLPSSIVNMLTLRYDPLQDPLIPKLRASDIKSEYISSKEIAELLKDVLREKISKKRIALALSSGVDSTLSLALIRELFTDIKIDCFCAIFGKESECKCAYDLAARFDANFHIIDFNTINVLNDLPLQLSIVKEPRWNLYFYYIIKEAARYSDTLVTGDGGDELFGGYTFRYSKFLKLLNNGSWKDKAMIYLSCHERDHVPDQHELFGSRIRFSWDDILILFKEYFDNELEPLQQVFLADFNGKLLFDWIPTNTKLFKHFNIQGISPFLDAKVIATAMSINPNLKFDKETGIGKIILRKILSDYNITINNIKIGLSLNTSDVYFNNKEIFKYYLQDARIIKDEWINKEWVENTFKHLENNNDIRYINKMLGLLAFEIWYRLFITKEMSANTRL